ncbi:MAG TPA: LysM peptidoglycan-binding domain-containing protein [Pseudolysinimonas sp.]|nr:LysM peptidoglycan-binding domain-containing protein [Pseudolysinimonas sp.]
MATVPIVLAGAMTVSLNLAGPVDSASAAPKKPMRPKSEFAKTLREILLSSAKSNAAGAAVPTTYRVAPGDSVSSIAGRYGLSTASVLALNGLSWKSLIFPGQVLKLSASAVSAAPAAAPAAGAGGRYTIVHGDTVSTIAARFGVTTQAVLTANGLGWSSIIYPGQTIAIPGTAPTSSPAPAVPAPAVGTSYTIVAGDTLSAIAARFGTTTAAIMAANSMGTSTIIYSGRTLIIPTGSAAPVLAATTVSAVTKSDALPDEMAANVRLIIQTGRRLGVPDRGIVVALSAAMQESGLRNLNYGDRDSVGLFQQRPSTGWGTAAQLLDPAYATRLFFGGPSNPNAGRTRGLLDIRGWQSMSIAQAAQAVQISAYPDAYAKWETSAWSWLAQYR